MTEYERGYRQGMFDTNEKISEEFIQLLKSIRDSAEILEKDDIVEALIEICEEYSKVRQ